MTTEAMTMDLYLAAREFEDRDMAFANLLYEVEEIVDSMKAGQL
jgi:hypothetical protein